MSSRPDIDIDAARSRIAGLAVRTPLVPSSALSDRLGADISLKLETVQPTGSFKVRGAASRILAASKGERSRGLVTASTGNHGRAVAYVGRRVGAHTTVCVSRGVPPDKVRMLEDLGAEVQVVGDTQGEALDRAHQIEAETGGLFVHPFDDPLVIAGQGTIGAEIADDMPGVSQVLVPLSGGGLLAGIATALSELAPDVSVVGVSMRRTPIMAMSLEAGHPVDPVEENTLADSLRGGIGLDNHHTFRIVSELVDDVVLVDEAEIWEAMKFCFEAHRLVVEGGAAVGIAALLSGAAGAGISTAVVISGANAEKEHVQRLLAGDPPPTLETD